MKQDKKIAKEERCSKVHYFTTNGGGQDYIEKAHKKV